MNLSMHPINLIGGIQRSKRSLNLQSIATKALGRAIRNFDDKVWKENARHLVTEGNVYKFSQNEDLRSFLLSTGDAVLVEASPRDCIWGIGLGQENANATNPTKWRGQNLLGFALMDVRERVK